MSRADLELPPPARTLIRMGETVRWTAGDTKFGGTMSLGIRLTGAQLTKVKAEIDRYYDTYVEPEMVSHVCDDKCADNCDIDEVPTGQFILAHPTQVLVEDFVERVLEAL